MARFLLRRVVLTAPVISSLLTRLAGDPVLAVAGVQASAADVEAICKAYGLDSNGPPQPPRFRSSRSLLTPTVRISAGDST